MQPSGLMAETSSKHGLSKATEAAVLDLWKKTNYSEVLWPFITTAEERHLELRLDGAVLYDLHQLAPDGDTTTLLALYFSRHASNISLWIDSDILIFDKDEQSEHVLRSYIRTSPSFIRLMYAVFGISALILLMAILIFFLRLFFTSALLDGLLVFSLFAFLLNAAVGMSAILFGWHHLRRDEQALQSMTTLHYLDLL